MQRFAPELFKIGARALLLPIGANIIVPGSIGLAGKQRDEFNGAFAFIQRRDERLNDADCPIVGSSIAPGLEFVRLIDVPLTKFCSLVLIEAEVYAQRNFVALQNFGEIEIRGCIVYGITPED